MIARFVPKKRDWSIGDTCIFVTGGVGATLSGEGTIEKITNTRIYVSVPFYKTYATFKKETSEGCAMCFGAVGIISLAEAHQQFDAFQAGKREPFSKKCGLFIGSGGIIGRNGRNKI